MSEEEYKKPPMAHFGKEENLKKFMEGQDSKDAEQEEEFTEEYPEEIPRQQIPYLEKEKGKSAFQSKNYIDAAKHYSKSLLAFNFCIKDNLIQEEAEMIKQITEIQVPCNLNLALCYQKMNEFMQALHFATQALELDPNNPKALYRKGIQNIYLQNFNDAHKDLLKAYQIDPQNKDIQQAFELLTEKKQKFRDKTIRMNQKIISGMQYSDDKPINKVQEVEADLEKKGFFRRMFNSVTYHSKLMFIIPIDFLTNTICKRRIPSQFFKKNV